MKLCMGCMENIEDQVATCPYCGYDETTLRQESYYLDPGTVVGGKYIVGRVMGYAGYTVTYLGMDAEQSRKVMIKEYLPSDFSTRSEGEKQVTIYSGDALEQFEQGLTTFLNEANRIQHLENVPGIAKVYDCVAENDTGYVISEYLEGQTLKEVLDSGRVFAPQEAKAFIVQILEGLRRVHPLDVIHCDIAPETIIITNTGEIKLLDFGATRYVTTANSKSLAIILKQGYAPEEQYRSHGKRGPWTDVYALAAVMYHMITGIVPDESVERALVDELKEPSKLGISIPENMENALMNALNVYQKDRTPSAEVFLTELNSPEVVRIHVKKKKYETGKFPRWAKGLVAGLLCLVLAGGGVVVYQLNKDIKQGENKKVVMVNLIGKTEKEAEDELKKAGIQDYEKTYHYDENAGKEGKVSSQTPTFGGILDKDKPTFDIGTAQKFSTEDLWDRREDVKDLKLNIQEEKGKDDKSHGHFYSVNLKKGMKLNNGAEKYSLNEKDLEQFHKTKQKYYIEISDIENIKIYVGSFWYVESLEENYEGQNINLGKFLWPKFIRKNKNGKPEKTGEKKRPLCDEIYISFSEDYKKGAIIEQRIKKDNEYDSSKEEKKLFATVKKQIIWSGKTGGQLKKELNELGMPEENIKVSSESGSDDFVEDVNVEGSEKGDKLIQKNEISKVKVTIKTKPRPTQESISEPTSSSKEKRKPERPDDANFTE